MNELLDRNNINTNNKNDNFKKTTNYNINNGPITV